MLREQLVEGIRNQSTKQDLRKLQTLTLQKSVDICRAAEKASIHSQSMGTEDVQVMKVYKTNRAKEPARQKECLFCGYLHAPKRSRCPAYGKLCNACKEKDHFESVPQKRQKSSETEEQHLKEKQVQCSTTTRASPWHNIRGWWRWIRVLGECSEVQEEAEKEQVSHAPRQAGNYLLDRRGSNHQHSTCKVR